MPLRLYNTLTQKVEDFVPQVPGEVKMYVCGMTTYDVAHAGHGRTYVTFDLLARHLRARGMRVTHVRNVTDVDDKIVNRAKERGEEPLALSKHYSELADKDLAAIGCATPDVAPRVSTSMAQIIGFIERLVEKESAYVAPTPHGNDVYFAVRSFQPYGKLSRRNLDDMRAGASERLADDAQDKKRDPLDFALWKASGDDRFGFESPWGKGRPGWHIECSAMALQHIGEHFDIHCGGMDLVFPHHENEIAQSEALFGPEMARFWLHAGFLEVDKEKMSKSLGNFVTIRDVLERNDAEAYRYFVLGTHYRGPLSFDVEKLDGGRVVFPGVDEAERRVEYLYATRDALVALAGDAQANRGNILQGQAEIVTSAPNRILEALDRDLNAPVALSTLAELGKAANEIVVQGAKMKKDPAKYEAVRALAAETARSLAAATTPLGLLQASPTEFWSRVKARRLRLRALDERVVDDKVRARSAARQDKNFARADQLRKELTEMGVEVFDAGTESTWKVVC